MKKTTFKKMIPSLFLIISAILPFTGCMKNSVDSNTDLDISSTGNANLSITLGKIGTLAKRSTIEMERLIIEISVKETDSIIVRDTSKISGHNELTISKTYTDLIAPEDLVLEVKSIDAKGKIIHQGATGFSTIPLDTTEVSIDLHAKYSMLKVSFNAVPDSVNKVALGIGAVDTLDSSFTSGSRDTVTLEYDYLEADSLGIRYAISLRTSGSFYGNDTVLYAADTTIVAIAGIDTSYRVSLKWVGPGIPDGVAAIIVTIGSIGTTKINAEFEETVKAELKLMGTWVGYYEKDNEDEWALSFWKNSADSLLTACYRPDGTRVYKGRVTLLDTVSSPCRFECIIEESSIELYLGTTARVIYTIANDTLHWAGTEPGSGRTPGSFNDADLISFVMTKVSGIAIP